ncbi:MAG TPA: hypothetical protein VNB94_07670 [Mycobacteriales bacterium]|nr:hypothetical protein [Mycobacteriales bacterium]
MALVSGCSRDTSGPPPSPPPVDGSLDRLADAIELVNDGRASVLERVTAVLVGLQRRDAVDALAAAGDRQGAQQQDGPADVALGRSAPALNDVGIALEAFVQGLDDLAAAAVTDELDATQRRLVESVVTVGRAEVSTTRALAAAVRTALPAYADLGVQLDEWLRRARAGWYRTREEAANAYAVLVAPGRPRLEAARVAVTSADGRRVAAVERSTAAIGLARRALAPLTTRPTEVAGPPSGLPGG